MVGYVIFFKDFADRHYKLTIYDSGILSYVLFLKSFLEYMYLNLIVVYVNISSKVLLASCRVSKSMNK